MRQRNSGQGRQQQAVAGSSQQRAAFGVCKPLTVAVVVVRGDSAQLCSNAACYVARSSKVTNQPTNTKQQKHWLEKASQPFTFSGLSDDHFHFYYYLLLLLLVGQRTNKGQRAATTESMREVQKKAKASQSQSLLGPCLQHHQRSVAYLALVVAAATVAVAADAPSLL